MQDRNFDVNDVLNTLKTCSGIVRIRSLFLATRTGSMCMRRVVPHLCAPRLMQLMPRLYRDRMKPGFSSKARRYACTACERKRRNREVFARGGRETLLCGLPRKQWAAQVANKNTNSLRKHTGSVQFQTPIIRLTMRHALR